MNEEAPTILDLLDAARTSRTIQQNFIEALFSYQHNLFQLESSVGQEIAVMISQARPILLLAASVAFLRACSQTQEPNYLLGPRHLPKVSHRQSAPQATGQIETAVVDFKPVQPELVLVGKVAYGEDRYSKISSPLQGRVVEVRARLGDHVEAGATPLVIDSADIRRPIRNLLRKHRSWNIPLERRNWRRSYTLPRLWPLRISNRLRTT